MSPSSAETGPSTHLTDRIERVRLTPLKLRYKDLVRMGIVGSRAHLRDLIIRGTIRPPHKDGSHHQSSAWWYTDDIMEDMARERAWLEGK